MTENQHRNIGTLENQVSLTNLFAVISAIVTVMWVFAGVLYARSYFQTLMGRHEWGIGRFNILDYAIFSPDVTIFFSLLAIEWVGFYFWIKYGMFSEPISEIRNGIRKLFTGAVGILLFVIGVGILVVDTVALNLTTGYSGMINAFGCGVVIFGYAILCRIIPAKWLGQKQTSKYGLVLAVICVVFNMVFFVIMYTYGVGERDAQARIDAAPEVHIVLSEGVYEIEEDISDCSETPIPCVVKLVWEDDTTMYFRWENPSALSSGRVNMERADIKRVIERE